MAITSQTRLVLCSDTHYWFGANRRFGEAQHQLQPWSAQIHNTLLAEVTQTTPDLVFHLGDLTCGGGFQMPADDFVATIDVAYSSFQTLPGDFHILPGNHDCPAGGDWTHVEQIFGLGAGLGKTIDLPGLRLILLNAQGFSAEQIAAALPDDPIYGWVNEAELARLEADLESAGQRPVLLFVHQLLQPWSGSQPWSEMYGVQNAPAVLDCLAHHQNVRAVFQAHAHRLDVQRVTVGDQSVWFVVQPALIEYPLGWLQLDLTKTQVQVTMKQLPLPELIEISLEQGEDRRWKAGEPAWQTFTIPLLSTE